GGVRHRLRDQQARDVLGSLDQRIQPLLQGPAAAVAGADHRAYAVGGRREPLVPARLLDRLVRGHDRELREAVVALDLLALQVLGRIEVDAAPEPVGDAGLAGTPALEEGVGPDPKRADRSDAGDND